MRTWTPELTIANPPLLPVFRRRPTWPRLGRRRRLLAGLGITGVFVLLAVAGPNLAPRDPFAQALAQRLAPPSPAHWMGTDEIGRDVFSRLIVGTRVSLQISVLSTTLGAVLGTVLGLIAGFYGRLIDDLINRLIDIMLALPGILIALAVIAALGVGAVSLVIAISVNSLPVFARLARGTTLRVKAEDYVLAAITIGASQRRTLWRHIVPNATPTLAVQFSLRIAYAMILAAGLSYLGLGPQPPTPEWGAMLTDARTYMQVAPHLMVFPGLAIILFVLGLNLLGDGLRDALDPQRRR
jgi:ABC-type dipeptide/oligopeptide/nickel transport system permease subunit